MMNIIHSLFRSLLKFLPLQDKVVFCNFFGRSLGDDPKYIALALQKLNPKVKLYWIINGASVEKLPEGFLPLPIWSRAYFYHLATSKVWVLNIKNIEKPDKKKGQLYIQTWHASISLKQVEKDVEATLNPDYVKASKKDSSIIDLMYANNDFQLNKYKTVYWYHGKIIKCDVPREAPLINPPKGLKETICRKYGVDINSKIVLYAPTFRKNFAGLEVYSWNYEKILKALSDKFGGHFVMFLRLHPNVANLSDGLHYGNDIVPVTSYPDMQELLSISDVMINDYSSSMFEFGMLLKRPVFLMAKDLTSYMSSDRTLEFSLNELPFPLATTEESLLGFISKFDRQEYEAHINVFNSKIGMEDKGTGDECLASLIDEFIRNGQCDTSNVW